jgi:hypothetical protein
VLELAPLETTVVTCLADPAAVDAAVAAWEGAAMRVAPDEALLIGGTASDAERAARAASIDDDALVLETTGGWAIWALEGEAASQAFARISDLRPPGGSVDARAPDGPTETSRSLQGEVAGVPAKVLAAGGSIVVVVASTWREAVRERILADCADLSVRERTEPRAWPSGGTRDER